MERQISYLIFVPPEYWEELELKWDIGSKWDTLLWKQFF